MSLDGKPQALILKPGTVFYQVLELKPLLGPAGERQYEPIAACPDLETASYLAVQKAGSLITLTVVIHQSPGMSAGAAAPALATAN